MPESAIALWRLLMLGLHGERSVDEAHSANLNCRPSVFPMPARRDLRNHHGGVLSEIGILQHLGTNGHAYSGAIRRKAEPEENGSALFRSTGVEMKTLPV